MSGILRNILLYQPYSSSLAEAHQRAEFYCNLEFGSGKVWTYLSAVALSEVVPLFDKFIESMNQPASKWSSHTLRGNPGYVVHWERENADSHLFVVTIRSGDQEVYKGRLYPGQLRDARNVFLLQVLSALCDAGLDRAARKYWTYFDDGARRSQFKFQIGERVRTIPGENVKTERVGYVISRGYHNNEASNLYHLLIDGKEYKKRYFERDLKRN